MWALAALVVAGVAEPDPARLLTDPAQLAAWLGAHSAELAAADARVQQARADVHQATLPLLNPSISASVAQWPVGPVNPYNTINGQPAGFGLHETLQFNAGVSQTLEVGKRGPRIRAAEAALGSEMQNREALLSQRVADARQALGHVVYLRLRRLVLMEGLALAMSALELEKTRMERGDLSGNDYDRLVLERVALEADLAQNQAETAQAEGDCQALLMAPCQMDDVSAQLLAMEMPRLEESERFLQARPDLRALDLAGAAAQEQATLERHKIFPDPSLVAGFTHDRFVAAGNNPNTVMFGLSLPVPVFDRGQFTERRALQHQRELMETRRWLLAQETSRLEALQAQDTILRASMQALRTDALPRSRSVLQSTMKSFRAGQLSLTDMLLARRAHAALSVKEIDLQFAIFTLANQARELLALDIHLPQKQEQP